MATTYKRSTNASRRAEKRLRYVFKSHDIKTEADPTTGVVRVTSVTPRSARKRLSVKP